MRQKENAFRAQTETMNMAYADIGKGLLKYLPMLAIGYAGYQYYAGRGFQGFLNDVQAITLEGLQAKWKDIAVGFSLIMGAPLALALIRKGTGNSQVFTTMKPIILAVFYYLGASRLFNALRSGAGYGGRRMGFNSVMRQVVG